ncbi:phytoene/squalene synthase family protein [Pedobacter aquatilis]|uniref:phytoene/squalene synthase family protein n=1 Tax=Pedobacter aquatilis TaxID=351343 RepID=UPI0025B4B2C5|nr:phytoene/squalene synthase family protein [Pedobacter aquatilis]MDN3587591.1 phytoene/squalene synthase family protein [Pedobacter aquatilis]
MINKAIFDKLSEITSKNTTRLYSTSFSLGIKFIDKSLRQPIYNIYGFVRLADEIVDSFDGFEQSALLSEFRKDCYKAIERKISSNPILNAFQKTVNEYNIDYELIECFLNSMEMDLSPVNFNESQYDQYILGSAQVVGLMCLKVFINGNNNRYEQLKPSAMLLGSAFQKVNFLRDLNADYQQLNRSYFPAINSAQLNKADKLNIEREIETEFDAALKGIKALPVSSGMGVYLAYIYYLKLFLLIKKEKPDQLLSRRIRISNWKKLLLMVEARIRYSIKIF